MTREEIDATYGRRRVVASAKGFRSIDTLFEIPESYLYALLVDALDLGIVKGQDYLHLFQDVRWAIDTAHRNGDIKAKVLAHRDAFILKDPELPMALDRWKRAGKKLFVVSNSEWAFTDGVLSYLLDGQDPTRPGWEDYFDLVVTGSRKPTSSSRNPGWPSPRRVIPRPSQGETPVGWNSSWKPSERRSCTSGTTSTETSSVRRRTSPGARCC